MLVPLVPFLLAANISATESDWKHGAEVIYDARIEGWTPPLNASGHSMIFNRTMKLHCQSDQSNSSFLRCKFGEASAAVTLLKPSGESQLVLNATDTTIMRKELGDRFDLYLPQDALNYQIIKPANAHDSNIALTKILASQLNIALDRTEATGEYDIVENSTLGGCKIKYVLASTENRPDYAIDNENYKIIITPESKDHSSDVISEIKRIRDVATCHEHFMSEAGVAMQLKSSVSRAIITKSGFTSFTESEVIFRDRRNPNEAGTIGRERITLSLDKIVRANASLPEIGSNRYTWKNQLVMSLFYSSSAEFVFRRPQGLYEFWLAAAGGKQAMR